MKKVRWGRNIGAILLLMLFLISALPVDAEELYDEWTLRPVIVNVQIDLESESDLYNAYSILDEIEKYGYTTVFVTGEIASLYPDVVKEIEARGHEIGVHGWRKGENLTLLSYEEQHNLIQKSFSAIRSTVNDSDKVVHFKPQGYKFNDDTIKALQDFGAKSISGIFSCEGPLCKCPYAQELGKITFPYPVTDKFWLVPISEVNDTLLDDEHINNSQEFLNSLIEKFNLANKTKDPLITVIHPSITGADEKKLNAFSQFLNYVKNNNGRIKPLSSITHLTEFIPSLEIISAPESISPGETITITVRFTAAIYCPSYYYRIYGKYPSEKEWRLHAEHYHGVQTGTFTFSKSFTIPEPPAIDSISRGVLSPEQIASLLVNRIDDDTAATMVAIALAESSGNSEAQGDRFGGKYSCNDYTSIGLWQIHMPAHYDKLKRHTGSNDPCVWAEWLKDPYNNVNVALEILNTQGLTAWSTYNNGAYKNHLSTAKDAVKKAKDLSYTIKVVGQGCWGTCWPTPYSYEMTDEATIEIKTKEFIWPVKGKITSGYGAYEKFRKDMGLGPHKGIDINGNLAGKPVRAVADGKVILAGWSQGLGNRIVIEHKNKVFTLYGHLASIDVKKGDVVKQGEVIGKVGNTGKYVTGPHLHFGVYEGSYKYYKTHVNPMKYLSPDDPPTDPIGYNQTGKFGYNYSDYGVDTEGDGLYNYLTVEVVVNITSAGVYGLKGQLTGSNGSKIIGWAENYTYLDLGNQTVQLYFDGVEIRAYRLNGPYNLTLGLYDEYGNQIDYQADAYTTSVYNYANFQTPLAELTDYYLDYGVDVDNDGLFDYLTIEVNVNATSEGNYRIEGVLSDTNDRIVAWAGNSTYLNNSLKPIQLSFDGRNINVGGNYRLKTLYLYSEDGIEDRILLDYKKNAYITSAYNSTDFQPSPVQLTGYYLDYGVDENTNGLFDYLTIDIGANITSAGNYSIAGMLYDENGGVVAWAYNSSYRNATVQTISLNFDGMLIYDHGLDGSYNLSLTINFENIFTDYKPHIYTTSVYNYTNFERGGKITGFVTDINGTPVYNAYIAINGPEFALAFTDVSGSYTIPWLKSGIYNVSVSSPPEYNLFDASATVNVTMGETTFANFTLQYGGVITGTVTDYNGDPVPDAYILAIGPTTASTITNINGTYRITGLQSGSYTIRVEPVNPNLMTTSDYIYLTAGETVVRNFTLQAAGSIAGYVTDVNGTGIPDVILYLSGYETPRYRTDENGYYVIPRLQSGTYTVNVDASGTDFEDNSTTVEVILGQTTVADFVLARFHGGSIAGRVMDENGTGVSNVRVVASGPSYGESYTNSTGYYTFTGLYAGSYTTSVYAPEYGLWYIYVNGIYTKYGTSVDVEVVLGQTTFVNFTQQPPPSPDIWVDPELFNITLPRGEIATRNLTIGNDGDVPLDFEIADFIDGIIADPSEGVAVDIMQVSAILENSDISFMIESYTDLPEYFWGYIWLDTDQDPNTGATDERYPGYGLNDIGADYVLILNVWGGYGEAYLDIITVEGWWEFVSSYPITLNERDLTISIPLSDIGDEGIMDVTVMIESYYDEYGIDIAPDEGHGTTGVEADWLSESPTSGTVEPSDQMNVTIIINATNLEVGEYDPIMVITSNDIDESRVTIPVHLVVESNLPPIANANGPYAGIEGQSITFNGSASYDPEGMPLTYYWEFGDGETAVTTQPTTSHVYAQEGNYTVTLIVNDSVQNSTPSITYALINDTEPKANFTANKTSGFAPLTVQFNDSSVSYDGITAWEWDFDEDGTIDSNEQNPTYTYDEAGTYTVSLTVYEADGDSDTETREDYITVTSAADTEPPIIESVTLDTYINIPNSTFHVTVEATDNVGVTSVTADGVALVETGSIWEGNITAPSSTGEYTLTIRAEDAAGNYNETTVDYSVVKPSGSIGIGVDPRLTTVNASDTAIINITLVSTENFDDIAYVYLTTEGVYPGYEANLTWFNWTSKYVKVPAGATVKVPLKVNIPAGESGYKVFYAKLESTKWTTTAMDTGVLYIV